MIAVSARKVENVRSQYMRPPMLIDSQPNRAKIHSGRLVL